MGTNSQKTEWEEKKEKYNAVMYFKTGNHNFIENSVKYWHYMTIKEETCF